VDTVLKGDVQRLPCTIIQIAVECRKNSVLSKSAQYNEFGKTTSEEQNMGLFSRKPKVSIEEFCRHFYDTNIFNTFIGGIDANLEWWQNAYNSIIEVDKSFKAVDFNKFQDEVTALRMELFGLAWQEKFKSERYTVPQSLFTRLYLQGIDKTQIWDVMGEYNQKIAMCATMTEDGKQIGEVGGGSGRAKAVGINKSRADMADRWIDTNIKDKTNITGEDEASLECVGRAVNRIGVDIKRFDCITVRQLSGRLVVRLDCDAYINAEAAFRLSALIFGLHEGAKEAIKDIDIQI
jgi:hypothetical protein